MYVDDDKVNLFTFDYTFKKYYDIHTASSASKGMSLLQEEDIQLVITDQRMPVMSGIQFLEEVATHFPLISRIILTAFTDSASIIDAINKGRVFSYITKPWNENDLKINIDNAVQSHQLQKENARLLADLKQANQELEQSQQKFSVAFYAAPIPISISSFTDGQFLDANHSYELLTGYGKQELLGKTTTEVGLWASPDEREEAKVLMQNQGRIYNFPHQIRTKQGLIKYTRLSSEVITINDQKNLLTLYLDITQEKRAQEKIIGTIIETEDRERRRIANELHDSLGQHLTTVSLNLSGIKPEIDQLSEKSKSKWEVAIASLKTAMNESRNISHNLMPKAIEDFGYVVAVENLLESLKHVTDIEFKFFNNLLSERLGKQKELGLFRITQEAINNIIKHADATTVNIQATKFSDLIILTIEDDGQGFDTSHFGTESFGLNSMKVRTEAMSGTLNIDSKIGSGTSITVQIPQQKQLNHGTYQDTTSR